MEPRKPQMDRRVLRAGQRRHQRIGRGRELRRRFAQERFQAVRLADCGVAPQRLDLFLLPLCQRQQVLPRGGRSAAGLQQPRSERLLDVGAPVRRLQTLQTGPLERQLAR
jgi:hypothetical protein